jgi:hypothetical protein
MISFSEWTWHCICLLAFTQFGGIYHESGATSCLSIMYISAAVQCHLSYSSFTNLPVTLVLNTSLNWLWCSFHEISYSLRKHMLNTVVSKHRRRNSPTLSDSFTWKGRMHPLYPCHHARLSQWKRHVLYTAFPPPPPPSGVFFLFGLTLPSKFVLVCSMLIMNWCNSKLLYRKLNTTAFIIVTRKQSMIDYCIRNYYFSKFWIWTWFNRITTIHQPDGYVAIVTYNMWLWILITPVLVRQILWCSVLYGACLETRIFATAFETKSHVSSQLELHSVHWSFPCIFLTECSI